MLQNKLDPFLAAWAQRDCEQHTELGEKSNEEL